MDNLSLVDLNGRVYDPTVARFLSAEPEVQAPYASQSLNRYSYTFDNPLNATDPRGLMQSVRIHWIAERQRKRTRRSVTQE